MTDSSHTCNPWRFCIAPMLDWTDRHDRYFLRRLSRHARLYTEMVTTGALLNSDPARWLDFHADEHPLALQLGGSDPAALARCSKLAEQWNYDEVNLNVGCPSDRVQGGQFGACLMATPALVADCIRAMRDATTLPVTVKCRIGIDDQDEYSALQDFVGTVRDAGCRHFIVHARKAWLKGLSPKENREIPPLNYPRVHRLKMDFSDLTIIINGGLTTLAQCQDELQHVDGVMVGREAYQNPWLLAGVDPMLFDCTAPLDTRESAIDAMMPYITALHQSGTPVRHVARHMLGLFHGMPGGKRWRRWLSEHGNRDDATPALLYDALQQVMSVHTAETATSTGSANP